jgi:uncharacterized protein YodC (DUF2158 family)
MIFAVGNNVRLATGGGLMRVTAVSLNSNGTQNVTCVDGSGKAGVFGSGRLNLEPVRGTGPVLVSPCVYVHYLG